LAAGSSRLTRSMPMIATCKPYLGRVGAACAAMLLIGACDDKAPSSGASKQPPADSTEKQTEAPQGAPPAAEDPADADLALLGQAAGLVSKREFEAAREMAGRYAKSNPSDGRAEFIIGLSYYGAGNRGRAVPHFERALELSPDYTLTRRYYGECLFFLGDTEGARREYEAWCAAEPDDPTSHYLVGVVDLEEAHLADAEARFRQAIELFDRMPAGDPRRRAFVGIRARSHARLGEVHFVREEYEAARRELIAATQADPHYVSAFFTLSQVYRRLGEDELAEQALARFQAGKRAAIEAEGGDRE
jgi:tetratricopeptide (TPR) repeat protein